MIKYQIDGRGVSIHKVKIKRETRCFYVMESGVKEAKISYGRICFFDSFHEAKNYIFIATTNKVLMLQNRLEQAKHDQNVIRQLKEK